MSLLLLSRTGQNRNDRIRTMTNSSTLSYSITFAVVANLTILLLALMQTWQFSELFFFLFMQSILVGAVALGTIFMVSLRLDNIASALGHSLFFILHYFSFVAILIFGVIYELGYLSLTTLNQGLTNFFTGTMPGVETTPDTLNLFPVLLVLGFFTLVQAISYFQKYRTFTNPKKSLAEIHIKPYAKHMFVFFFVFTCAITFVQATSGYEPGWGEDSAFSQIILLAFFVSITLIEVFGIVASRKLGY
jgi:hypothetical protein